MTGDGPTSNIKDQNPIDWQTVERVLVVKLRSIGDTVLSTPSLIALKRFVPNAKIDILLEDWVAPLLEGHDAVDRVIAVGKGKSDRLRVAMELRRRKYDVVFNLHGGTTATFFTAASRARHRVGFAEYRFSFLYNHLLSSASDFWQTEFTHSAEQQLALLGFVGVPVEDRPKSRLDVTESALESVAKKLHAKTQSSQSGDDRSTFGKFALMHPASAFFTKQWATANFARTAEFLAELGIQTVAVASRGERAVLDELVVESRVPVPIFDNLTLPEIMALASRAAIFVGNDSGIAHISAAVGAPTVVIFGSSNRNHWRPWTDAPNAVVFKEFACQPCPGYECKQFGRPRCVLEVPPADVFAAIDRVVKPNE